MSIRLIKSLVSSDWIPIPVSSVSPEISLGSTGLETPSLIPLVLWCPLLILNLWASVHPQHCIILRTKKILLTQNIPSVLGSRDEELGKDHIFIPVISQVFLVVSEQKCSILGGWSQMAWTRPKSDWMVLILEMGSQKYESKDQIFLLKSVLCSPLYTNELSLSQSSVWILRKKEE